MSSAEPEERVHGLDNTGAGTFAPTTNKKKHRRRAKLRECDQVTSTIKLVISDQDGTTSCWASYWAPYWTDERVIERFAHKFNILESEVCDRIADVIYLTGTHEYPWMLEMAFGDLWKGTPQEFINQISRPYWDMLDIYRKRHLQPYPTVIGTLQLLQAARIPVVILSDAPHHMLVTRYREVISRYGAARAIKGLYGIETIEPQSHQIPNGDERWLAYGRERIERLSSGVPSHIRFNRQFRHHKPDRKSVRAILDDFRVTDPREVAVIGDSRLDGFVGEEVARELGGDDNLTPYGRTYFGQWPDHTLPLLRGKLAARPGRHSAIAGKLAPGLEHRPNPRPRLSVHRFDELIPLFGLGQGVQFTGGADGGANNYGLNG